VDTPLAWGGPGMSPDWETSQSESRTLVAPGHVWATGTPIVRLAFIVLRTSILPDKVVSPSEAAYTLSSSLALERGLVR